MEQKGRGRHCIKLTDAHMGRHYIYMLARLLYNLTLCVELYMISFSLQCLGRKWQFRLPFYSHLTISVVQLLVVT